MTAEAVPLAPPPQGWTIEDVDALPDNGLRYELVDGVPRVMTPPKRKHQRAARRAANLLEDAAPAGLVVDEAVGVVLAPDQRPVPDLVVLRGYDGDDEVSNFPAERIVLVAEVVSRSSRSDDRFRKPAQYAQAAIPFYLRIELEPLHVVGYRIGADGLYVEYASADAGALFTIDEPFPLSFDPAVLVR
ncbi:MAG: Uma2 family endonuclease [Pseudonocardia sp.]